MKTVLYQMDVNGLSKQGAAVMSVVVAQMIYEGFLTKELGNTFLDRHVVVCADDRSFMRTWIERFWPDFFADEQSGSSKLLWHCLQLTVPEENEHPKEIK